MPHPLDILASRGLVQDVTDPDGLRSALTEERATFYYGADPTATSLHIGNLIGIMAMAWLQRSGHRPIALAGGGTGRIGDPSGADDERELLSEDKIASNIARIREQLSRVIDLSTPEKGLILDNNAWLSSLRYVEFLRDVGKHFSVNQMIARESVRRRLEEREHGISYTEFSYQLLQAYDFAHLYRSEGCTLQIGGSDQWGNITAGVDLTRRMHGGKVFGLVWPLVERADGKKFSKSTGEAVWLAADETSPYAYYQWFLNVPDADTARFLRLYTFLPLDDIAALDAELAADPAKRAAQAYSPMRPPASSTVSPVWRRRTGRARCSLVMRRTPASTPAPCAMPLPVPPRWTFPPESCRWDSSMSWSSPGPPPAMAKRAD